MEFQPNHNIPLHKVKKLLETVPEELEKQPKKKKRDGWNEEDRGDVNILQ